MPSAKKLGENVRAARTRRKLTQEQIALDAGLRLSFVSEIECGKRNISVDTLLKLAGALNVTPAHLLKGVGLDDVD